jgi:hypothetical protein
VDDELRAMVSRLRERRNLLKGGDGFGYAGTLIGAYKRSIAKIEELIALVENAPAEEPEATENPNCWDGTPGCTCKEAWYIYLQKYPPKNS